MQNVDALARRLVHPAERLRNLRQQLFHLATRLATAAARRFDQLAAQIERARTSLTSLDPRSVLARGYSLTRNAAGEVIRDPSRIAEGEQLTTTLAKGWIESRVLRKSR